MSYLDVLRIRVVPPFPPICVIGHIISGGDPLVKQLPWLVLAAAAMAETVLEGAAGAATEVSG